MGEGSNRSFQETVLRNKSEDGNKHIALWIIDGGERACDDAISTEASSEESNNSTESSSDLVEDASSSTSYSSSSLSSTSSNGPLYELSELMAQLPIKRGLSKCYEGKSQSFTSLASVKSIEDLAKRQSPYRKRMNACKSYGGRLDGQKFYMPKAVIAKKASRESFSSLLGKKGSLLGSLRAPVPVEKNFKCAKHVQLA